ncbi:hypothetical protein Tco_0740819 [Tanacetum coccineum]
MYENYKKSSAIESYCKEKFQWVATQAKKLGIPPSPELTTFELPSAKKKTNLKKKEVLKSIKSCKRNSAEAKEMYNKLNFVIEARNDIVEARKIVLDNLDNLRQHQLAKKLDELMPKIVADVFEERIPELLYETLKNILPELIKDSVKQSLQKFDKRMKKTLKATIPNFILKLLNKEFNALNTLESRRVSRDIMVINANHLQTKVEKNATDISKLLELTTEIVRLMDLAPTFNMMAAKGEKEPPQ